LNYPDIFSKNSQILNLMQIRPVEVELFHVEGRTDRQTGRQAGRWTDMTKLIVIFRNFSKAPKNCFNVRYCAATDEVM